MLTLSNIDLETPKLIHFVRLIIFLEIKFLLQLIMLCAKTFTIFKFELTFEILQFA